MTNKEYFEFEMKGEEVTMNEESFDDAFDFESCSVGYNDDGSIVTVTNLDLKCDEGTEIRIEDTELELEDDVDDGIHGLNSEEIETQEFTEEEYPPVKTLPWTSEEIETAIDSFSFEEIETEIDYCDFEEIELRGKKVESDESDDDVNSLEEVDFISEETLLLGYSF